MTAHTDTNGNYVRRQPFVHFLDTNGDGTGTRNAIGDYSVTPTSFFFAPAPGVTVDVTRLIYHVADKGGFAFDGYGALAAGVVTNGVTIAVYRLGQLVLKLTDDHPLIHNADVSHLNTDYTLTTFANNHQAITVSLNTEAFGIPLLMHGDLDDEIHVELSDNFTGIDDHHFILYGHI